MAGRAGGSGEEVSSREWPWEEGHVVRVPEGTSQADRSTGGKPPELRQRPEERI